MRTWSGALFPLTLLLALAALTLWLKHAIELPDVGRDGKFRHDPDLVIERFAARKLDPAGRLQYRLDAPKMVHYPDKDTTEISDPRFTYLRGEAPTATLTAVRAEVTGRGDKIVFRDKVLIERMASADQEPVQARMSDLTVVTDSETATTEHAVEVTRGKSWVRGVGMDFDNKAGTIVLKSQVTGRIESRKHR